jgi:hypothetical protein
MPGHDAFARLTPYELSFPDLDFARRHFAAIRREAEARGVDLGDASAFVMLAATGQALREIRGPEDDPRLIHQYGFLLYHSFHFCEAGEPLYLVQAPALRELLDGDPPGAEWAPALEPRAGYAQLPQHLVWVRAAPGLPPDSLDGFFWSRGTADRFGLLLALGMRGDRPGLSVVPLADLPLAEASEWTRMEMREGGRDFSSSLPGSELDGLYELRSSGEALKLAARLLWRLESAGGIGSAEKPAAQPDGSAGPRPSALGYRRVGKRPGRVSGRSQPGRRSGKG